MSDDGPSRRVHRRTISVANWEKWDIQRAALTTPDFDEVRALASMRQVHCAIEHLNRGDFECAITLARRNECCPILMSQHFVRKSKPSRSLRKSKRREGPPVQTITAIGSSMAEPEGDNPRRRKCCDDLASDHEIQRDVQRPVPSNGKFPKLGEGLATPRSKVELGRSRKSQIGCSRCGNSMIQST